MAHPDEVIQKQYREQMNAIAEVLDDFLNGSERPKKTCFVLLVAPFGTADGRVNYISNGSRTDIVNTMKELLARFGGQPELSGRA